MFSQKSNVDISKGELIIRLNTEINVNATLKKSKVKAFDIISEKAIDEIFGISELIGDDVNEISNDFYIWFGNTELGNLKSTVLILKHNLNQSITFAFRIKLKGKDLFENPVVTSPTEPNIALVSQWIEEIKEIKLYDFKYTNN